MCERAQPTGTRQGLEWTIITGGPASIGGDPQAATHPSMVCALRRPSFKRAAAPLCEHHAPSDVNASSRLGGTILESRLSACLTEANWWRLIAE